MSSFTFTTFRKPRPVTERKPLNRSAKKGDFWKFCSAILNEFFLRIAMPQRCEACDGTSYCGPITPAHTRRRQDIRVGDWEFALRVAVLGSGCHYGIDSKGRRDAEPILERIISERFKKMGLTEAKVRNLLLTIAEELQAKNEKFAVYHVSF